MTPMLHVTSRGSSAPTLTAVIDRWLAGESASTDPDLAALTTAMFDANPSLRAVSTAHLAEVISVAGPAFLTELGLPADHAMVKIAGAAVGAAIGEYLSTVPATGVSKENHQEFMRYLRAIVTAAQARKTR